MRWFFPLFLFVTLTFPAFGKVIDYVEITVNNIPILHSEIEKYASENKVSKKIAEEELIDKALLLSEAEREGLSISNQTLETALKNLAKSNGFKSIEDFRKAVEQKGIQWESLKKKLKEQLLIQKLIALKIKKNLKISDTDVEKACEAEGTKAREVYYVITDNNTLAEEIESHLKKGLPFENATKTCTQENNCKSGFLGDVKKGMLLKPIDNIVWSSKIGIPTTVNINGKIYIIYVKAEKQQPCNTKRIKEKLLKEEYEKALKSLIENLKSTAHIEHFEP